mmetsp:Transcript_145945/g.467895  ORF Transcript_145945/g.467895 Transcript_145945/m.467895 type:complete len:908 (+) Transcript_145945:112-2835(+)
MFNRTQGYDSLTRRGSSIVDPEKVVSQRSLSRRIVYEDGSESDYSHAAGSSSSSSSTEAEGKQRNIPLQEDIFAHAVVTYLKKGGMHQDTVRATLLMLIVLACQAIVSISLFVHCWIALNAYGEDITDAMKRRGTSEFAPEDETMSRICGQFTSEREPISNGLGEAYVEFRRWLDASTPTSRIETLNYQLRIDFQLVFTVVTVFWAWRCLYEIRVALAELRAVGSAEEANAPSDDGPVQPMSSAAVGPSGGSKREAKLSSAALLWKAPPDGAAAGAEDQDIDITLAGLSRSRKAPPNDMSRRARRKRLPRAVLMALVAKPLPDDAAAVAEKQDTGISLAGLSGSRKVITASVLLLRLMVAVFLFIDGYILLCMTERTIDVIMNALALEFIFDIDDLIVKVLLSKKETGLLTSVKFSSAISMLRFMHHEHSRKRMRLCYFNCKSRRCRVWVRTGLLVVVVVFLVYPRQLKVRSMHARSKILCLTDGLTDGTRRLPKDSPEVVFPVQAFCRSFISMYSGLPEPSCGAWRLRMGESLSMALCSVNGNLAIASWAPLSSIEEDTRRICMEMWFGNGLNLDAPVPALRRATGRDTSEPQMFGCRREDVEIHEKVIPWVFFTERSVSLVTLHCKRPAFGPRSAVWNSTPLTSAEHIPPPYFFRFDPHSPIEHQVDACRTLPALRHCHGDSCEVLMDQSGTSCHAFCQEQGLICASAGSFRRGSLWSGSRCPRSREVGCGVAANYSGALVCRCQMPDETRKCGLLPNARARCDGDPCAVLVSLMDYGSGTRTNYSTCTEYCATANLPCKGQFRSSPTMAGTDAASEGYFHSCARDLRQTLVCASPLPDPHEAGGDHDGDVMEASTPARFDGRRLHEGGGHGHAAGGSGTGRGLLVSRTCSGFCRPQTRCSRSRG